MVPSGLYYKITADVTLEVQGWLHTRLVPSPPLVYTNDVGTYDGGILEAHMSGILPQYFGQIVHPRKHPSDKV